MAQPPLKLDALEIVGDSGVGVRLIESDATTGELLFSDAVVSARKLAEIIGLQGVDGVIVCGSGDGVSKDADNNPITTLQAAFAAVPTSASASNPWLILLMPGSTSRMFTLIVTASRSGDSETSSFGTPLRTIRSLSWRDLSRCLGV